jgi:hypothetical protein
LIQSLCCLAKFDVSVWLPQFFIPTRKAIKKEPNAEKPKIKRGTTPIGKLDELEEGNHPFQEKEPLKAHPGGVNPGSNKIYF